MTDLSPERSRSATPLRRISTSHQLHDLIRSRIVQLELVPGAAVSRADLAEQYGVSQTPVRDALQMLEQDGLVVVYPQSRTEVTKIDVAQARETQFLRLSLELAIAAKLATGSDRSFAAGAARLLRQQKAALELDRDFDRFTQLDRDFHLALFTAAGVPDLWGVVQERSGHIDRLRKLNLLDPGKAATILSAHHEILDAIVAGDVAAAQDAVRSHLSGTLASVDAIMEHHPQFF